jgi:hypothetical protein
MIVSRSRTQLAPDVICFVLALIICLASNRAFGADRCLSPGGTPLLFSVNVKAFGAIGDGAADDTSAIARAAACAASLLEKAATYSAEIYFPAGVYAISRRIEVNDSVAEPVAGSLVVRGDGMLASRIIERGQAGILALSFANITTQVQVSELGFFTASPAGGAALSIEMPAKGLIQRRAVTIRDLTIGGMDIHRDFFETGLLLRATSRPLIDDVLMTGPYGPGSDLVGRTGTCFELEGTYSPTIVDSACWAEQTGLRMSAIGQGRMEGVFITRSKFVNVDYGISITNPGQMPEGMISENHINAHVVGLSLKGKKFVTIRDNLFYHQTSRGDGVYTDISLDDTAKILMTGNTFHFPSDSNRVAIHIENSRDDTIALNMFNQPGDGIVIGRGARNTDIVQNRFFVQDDIKRIQLNTTPIIDKGTGTKVVLLPPESGIDSAQ